MNEHVPLRGSTIVTQQAQEVIEGQQRLADVEALKIRVSETATRVNAQADIRLDIQHLNFFYGAKQALFDVLLPVRDRQVTALIGPSGCGKSTLLRTLNRMNDLIAGTRIEGKAMMGDEDIFGKLVDVVQLRQRIGMVFQRPNPFPQSIYDNITYGLRMQRLSRREMQERVESSLRGAALWDEVKDRLKAPATGLSGGQQQRLCIARAIAVQPEVLLMDEPTSALDPLATEKIEALINELRRDYTIVLVTHNMQQAARVSQFTGFFLSGSLIECTTTVELFTHPRQEQTEHYISGRFG